MKIYCCTDNRRQLIREKTALNGIDYIEVLASNNVAEKQRLVRIQFLKNLTQTISVSNIYISIKDQLTHLTVEEIILAEDEKSQIGFSGTQEEKRLDECTIVLSHRVSHCK